MAGENAAGAGGSAAAGEDPAEDPAPEGTRWGGGAAPACEDPAPEGTRRGGRAVPAVEKTAPVGTRRGGSFEASCKIPQRPGRGAECPALCSVLLVLVRQPCELRKHQTGDAIKAPARGVAGRVCGERERASKGWDSEDEKMVDSVSKQRSDRGNVLKVWCASTTGTPFPIHSQLCASHRWGMPSEPQGAKRWTPSRRSCHLPPARLAAALVLTSHHTPPAMPICI